MGDQEAEVGDQEAEVGDQEAEVGDQEAEEEPPTRENAGMDHQGNISSEEEEAFEAAMDEVRRVLGERGLAVAMMGL